MKLHTKYQRPGPSSFREDFKMFPYGAFSRGEGGGRGGGGGGGHLG